MRLSAIALLFVCLISSPICFGGDLLFEDNFDKGLSKKWQIIGLEEEDYRFRNGGIELRVPPGKFTEETPRLKVILPFTSADTVIASVDVTILDRFTESAEFAGLYLIDERGAEFGARKQEVDGHVVFSPGRYKFVGLPGEEGDSKNYAVHYQEVTKGTGALRIIVRSGNAYFQVGPSTDGKYANFFHSAIRKNEKQRGFILTAAGGPKDVAHWVRFDNFRVEKK